MPQTIMPVEPSVLYRIYPDRMAHELTDTQVKHIAKLSRLRVTDQEVSAYRAQIGAVLAHMETLRALDLAGVEPLAHVSGAVNRLDDDEPRAMLATEDLMKIAPATDAPFVKVPKVLGDGGGA